MASSFLNLSFWSWFSKRSTTFDRKVMTALWMNFIGELSVLLSGAIIRPTKINDMNTGKKKQGEKKEHEYIYIYIQKNGRKGKRKRKIYTKRERKKRKVNIYKKIKIKIKNKNTQKMKEWMNFLDKFLSKDKNIQKQQKIRKFNQINQIEDHFRLIACGIF